MRKTAFILNIIGAVLLGVGAVSVFFVCLMWPSISEMLLQFLADNGSTIEQVSAFRQMFDLYYVLLWVAMVFEIIGAVFEGVAAGLNKKAVSKSAVVAPAVLSIVFGGLLGIIAGIFLLVAKDEEFASPLI